jgi:hypothetical protein
MIRYLTGMAVLVGFAAAGALQSGIAADKRDRTIVPGVRVGGVTAGTTLAQLRSLYGARNVRAKKVHVGEGQFVDGLVLFPGTRAEVEFRYGDGTKRIALAVISKPKSPWKTRSGIGIGTTGARLERLNGKPFSLYGFEWDYSGRLASWNGGKLPASLIPDFKPGVRLPARQAQKVMGDAKFSSANPVMRRSKIVVYRLLVGLK